MGNRVLVVAAHPDDEILGVGGTVKKISEQGGQVYALILGEGMQSRDIKSATIEALHAQTLAACKEVGYQEVFFSHFPDNQFDGVHLLLLIKEVERYIERLKPDVIYTHHHGDLNVDHRQTFDAVLTASRPIFPQVVKSLYTFETLSSTEWQFQYQGNGFRPNVFVDISEVIEAKKNAMKQYTIELRNYPHPRSIKGLETLAQYRGMSVGFPYAEAFELIFSIDQSMV